jgi:hypothetical protein
VDHDSTDEEGFYSCADSMLSLKKISLKLTRNYLFYLTLSLLIKYVNV